MQVSASPNAVLEMFTLPIVGQLVEAFPEVETLLAQAQRNIEIF